jgi:hypothetical protein
MILLIAFALVSCKSFYKEPQEIEYDCILAKTQFFADIKNIIVDEKFEIAKSDEFHGYMVAEKKIKTDKNEDVLLTLSLKYDETNKKYFVTPSSIKFPRDQNEIEYYTKKCMRKEYKTYFKSVLTRMESFCKGGYFPNK